ncbi:porin [Bdellovibrio sp. 22V]|uniref:porin n=1 Tax=Bdellovibrio sp. 22V TaxID=3044166 RepID=UPI002543D497|nr:porin [Bdellovibrio sp. 22V]WII70613.1 porin [Bdellovibrio sp. 22V]
MKKFLFASLISVMAVHAQAGSLSLDMRADYNSTTYDESPLPDFTKFYFKTGRLDYQGKATEDLSYRVRLAFNKDAAVQTTDSTQVAVEYAYLSHKMSELFTLSVGKFNTEFGGFEGATSGADLYLTSEFYTMRGLDGSLDGLNLGTTNLLYMTGVKGTFSFAGQQVHVMATNETNGATEAGDPAAQNSSLYGVVWRGGFMEKALNFNLSYHTMNGPAADDKHQFMAAGVMWNLAPITASADYLVSEFKQDASGDKDTVTSIVAKLAYTGWEQWTPRLEFTTSEEKIEIGGAATNKFTGYGAVLEYKPWTDTNFRYHVAYNTIKEAPEVGEDMTKQEVVVGARLLADFLK